MTVTQYKGPRMVPLVPEPGQREWDKTKSYEYWTLVQYQGASYISVQNVPVGIDITNECYWLLSANYNAQIDAYYNIVKELIDVTAKTFETVSDMLEYNASEGMYLKTNAFYGNNCGGGLYHIESNKTANNASILKMNNGLFAVLQYNPFEIELNQFGADPSGINDSTNYILEASRACVNGSTIIGCGSYLTGTIYIPAKNKITLRGGSYKNINAYALIDVLDNSSEIVIADVLLDCASHGDGMHIHKSYNVRIQNSTIKNFANYGVYSPNNIHEVVIDNCNFFGSDTQEVNNCCVYLANNDNIISRCVMSKAGKGIYLVGGANQISDNHIWCEYGDKIGLDIAGSEQMFSSNYIDGCTILIRSASQLTFVNTFILGKVPPLIKIIGADDSSKIVLYSVIFTNTYVHTYADNKLITLGSDYDGNSGNCRFDNLNFYYAGTTINNPNNIFSFTQSLATFTNGDTYIGKPGGTFIKGSGDYNVKVNGNLATASYTGTGNEDWIAIPFITNSVFAAAKITKQLGSSGDVFIYDSEFNDMNGGVLRTNNTYYLVMYHNFSASVEG